MWGAVGPAWGGRVRGTGTTRGRMRGTVGGRRVRGAVGRWEGRAVGATSGGREGAAVHPTWGGGGAWGAVWEGVRGGRAPRQRGHDGQAAGRGGLKLVVDLVLQS